MSRAFIPFLPLQPAVHLQQLWRCCYWNKVRKYVRNSEQRSPRNLWQDTRSRERVTLLSAFSVLLSFYIGSLPQELITCQESWTAQWRRARNGAIFVCISNVYCWRLSNAMAESTVLTQLHLLPLFMTSTHLNVRWHTESGGGENYDCRHLKCDTVYSDW